jgi:hypothetical protein
MSVLDYKRRKELERQGVDPSQVDKRAAEGDPWYLSQAGTTGLGAGIGALGGGLAGGLMGGDWGSAGMGALGGGLAGGLAGYYGNEMLQDPIAAAAAKIEEIEEILKQNIPGVNRMELESVKAQLQAFLGENGYVVKQSAYNGANGMNWLYDKMAAADQIAKEQGGMPPQGGMPQGQPSPEEMAMMEQQMAMQGGQPGMDPGMDQKIQEDLMITEQVLGSDLPPEQKVQVLEQEGIEPEIIQAAVGAIVEEAQAVEAAMGGQMGVMPQGQPSPEEMAMIEQQMAMQGGQPQGQPSPEEMAMIEQNAANQEVDAIAAYYGINPAWLHNEVDKVAAYNAGYNPYFDKVAAYNNMYNPYGYPVYDKRAADWMDNFSNAASSAREGFGQIGDSIGNYWGNKVNQVGSAVADTANTVGNYWGNKASQVGNAVSRGAQAANEWGGQQAINAENAWNRGTAAVGRGAQAANEWGGQQAINAENAVRSGARAVGKFGNDTMNDLARGKEEMMKMPGRAWAAADNIPGVPQFKEAGRQAYQGGQNVAQSVGNYWGNAADQGMAAVGRGVDAVGQYADNFGNQMGQAGQSFGNAYDEVGKGFDRIGYGLSGNQGPKPANRTADKKQAFRGYYPPYYYRNFR